MSYIEVVRLRASRGNLIAAGLLHVFFAFGYAREVVAHADDFCDPAEESVKRFDHGRRKFYGPLFTRHVRGVGITHEPVDIRVEPHVESMILDGLDYSFWHSRREKLLVDDCFEVGLNQHAAIK